jgi:hypothetical protein
MQYYVCWSDYVRTCLNSGNAFCALSNTNAMVHVLGCAF